MSEANLYNPDPEIQKPLSDDGAEVLQGAQTAYEKGVTRRGFIRLTGATIASWLLSSCLPEQPPEEQISSTSTASSPIETTSPTETASPIERYLQPEFVHGVEVYGLDEAITSEDQINRLYESLDEKFATENNITIGDKVEQRKELLDPSERYLEIVVRQSAYDSFLKRREETQVDFVGWIQMHVDAMNRCFENATPPADIKSVLRRITVISDDLPQTFWDEDKYRKGEEIALDWAWDKKFLDKTPINTDYVWAIADDYRVDQTVQDQQGYFWSFRHRSGKTIFGNPPGSGTYDRTYDFPEKDDSLQNNDGVWLDFGLIHEWLHCLWNGPDEYNQDVHDTTQRFQHFLFATGSFHEPSFSAYLSGFLKLNVERKLRDCYRDSRWYDFSDRPNEINISATSQDIDVSSIGVRRVILKDDNVAAGEKSFKEQPDQQNDTNNIDFRDLLFEGNSNCWLVQCDLSDGSSREIYIPAAAFGISTAADVDSARYEIEFSGHDSDDKKTQIVKLIDQSDIDRVLDQRKSEGDPYYAKMKVDGTNTWFVWFLRD